MQKGVGADIYGLISNKKSVQILSFNFVQSLSLTLFKFYLICILCGLFVFFIFFMFFRYFSFFCFFIFLPKLVVFYVLRFLAKLAFFVKLTFTYANLFAFLVHKCTIYLNFTIPKITQSYFVLQIHNKNAFLLHSQTNLSNFDDFRAKR